MRRWMIVGTAGLAVWSTLVMAEAPSEGDVLLATENPEWAQGLCAAVEDGVRLLETSHLVPAAAVARSALLEALIRAAEPGVEFLDADTVAARSQTALSQEWDAGVLLAPMDNRFRVAAVRSNYPAAAAGLLPGEFVDQIADNPIAVDTPLKTVRRWLAQGDKAELELGVLTADGTRRTIELERVRRLEASVAEVERLPSNMGYVRVAGVFPGASDELSAALEEWRGTDVFGLILDLRGAAGNAEAEVAPLAAPFAVAGTMLYVKSDRQGHEEAVVKAPAASANALPLMVLTDEDTVGAAELLAAVLGGSVKGAMLIGRETAGDPLIREPILLSTGRYALLATREIRTADGVVYWGAGGVKPDVVITDAALNETVFEPDTPMLRKSKILTEEDKEDKALRDRTRHDTYLRRATDVLLGLQALGYDGER